MGTAVPIQSRSRQVAVMFSIMPDTGWRYHPKHVEQIADVN